MTEPPESISRRAPPPSKPLWRRVLRRAAWFGLGFVGAALCYLLAALILGLVPVNADWQPPESGTAIYVWSNGVHTDFVVPVRSPGRDWTAFAPLANGNHAGQGWVQFGWGDRGFYLETPTWSDLSVATTLRAIFWPSPAVLHVGYLWQPPLESEVCIRLVLTDAQMKTLAQCIEAAFCRDDSGHRQRIPGASYHADDEFWEANGSYHLFYTCNSWANSVLAEVGVCTPVWSPFHYAIFYQLR